jgi:hypothetical protein
MAQTTPRGITYDESTDDTAIWTHLQSTATTTDTAIGAVESSITTLDNTQPYAQALVSAVLAGTGGSSYTQAFTWPVGRFTVGPATVVTNVGGVGSSQFYIQCTAQPSTSGGTVICNQRDGTTVTLTALNVRILGVQMTSSTAAG